MKNILAWISVAYALAWAIVVVIQPSLWPVALLGFVQNIAFAHWLERGKARSVREDKFTALARRVTRLEAGVGRPYNETLIESMTKDGRTLRIWVDPEVQQRTGTAVRLQGLLNDPGLNSESTPEVARLVCERLEANAVQCGGGSNGSVYYREWP